MQLLRAVMVGGTLVQSELVMLVVDIPAPTITIGAATTIGDGDYILMKQFKYHQILLKLQELKYGIQGLNS